MFNTKNARDTGKQHDIAEPSFDENPHGFTDMHDVMTSTMKGVSSDESSWSGLWADCSKQERGADIGRVPSPMDLFQSIRGGNALIALKFYANEIGPYAQVCSNLCEK